MLAITKTVESNGCSRLWRLGLDRFGENRVQEAEAKVPDAP